MKKPKKRTTFKEDAGKLLQDFGKLVFAGIFLGGILRGGVSNVILITSGFVMALALSVLGLLLGIKEKKE